MRSLWSLLYSKLNKPNSLKLSSQEKCSRLLIVFEALLWTHSNSSASFLFWEPQAWAQYCARRWGLMKAVRGGQSPPFHCCHSCVDAAQNTVGLLGCKHTLLAHVQLFRMPKSFSSGMLSVSSSPSLYS